ncbi:MAG: DUF5320 domain-containing protein [Chloroflexi bacterium]|nr:DUF5320 domain-containing protein [Chloroflexota bacterium]
MPRGDRTGPMGEGPMTGRGAGTCAGYDMPGYAHPFPRGGFGRGWGRGGGRGWARGMGRGFRWRHWHYAMGMPAWPRFGYGPAWGPPPMDYGPYAPSPDEELDARKEQAQWLKEELEAISQRIEELEGEE